MIEWDYYWTIKQTSLHRVYDHIAVFYRQNIIKPHLGRFIHKYMKKNDIILHAGCGGGQVEEEIAGSFTIIGMDISSNAITLYKQFHAEPNLILGDILSIGIKHESLDGVYNLGVMEHFSEDEIDGILREFHRIVKKDGVVILFWPPEYGSTVLFFKLVHFILNSVLRRNIFFQPPEPSRIRSKTWVAEKVKRSGFALEEISFGLEDFYTNMVVVLRKTDSERGLLP
jgi:ubiquinone/menaquinone biosynthesis C-methylase UbiE